MTQEFFPGQILVRGGAFPEWERRLKAARPMLQLARERGLTAKPWAVEALAYWHRADKLQRANLAGRKIKTGDDLQDTITIYDTTRRRYAGFSNVLEQLWYGETAPKFQANRRRGFDYPLFEGTNQEWLYLCLVHRITGSGASFEHDHGFRNTIVPTVAALPPAERAPFLRVFNSRPIFTSIGNQIPPFRPKTLPECKNAGHEYLATIAPRLVEMVYEDLVGRAKHHGPMGIKDAVDTALTFHDSLGQRRFNFVLTAWVMDMAEYLPMIVDPHSDCYHGKNAIEAMELCFDRKQWRESRQAFYDTATRLFADVTGTYPMDVEDAAPGCDLIRWVENYIPKRGYEHFKGFNSCCLVYDKGRQP